MASKTTNYNLDMPGYDEIADIDVINGNMDKIDVQMKKNADSAQQSKDIVSDKYSATNTYAVGDYCIHENILYKCKTAITTGEAFDSNKWVQTTCGTEFKELNSNLEDYGLDNKFDGELLQGYRSGSTLDYVSGSNYVTTKNKIQVGANSSFTVKLSKTVSTITVFEMDSSGTLIAQKDLSNNKELTYTTSANCSSVYIQLNSSGITPSTVGHIGVYINNAIDELKNDLGGLSFSVSGTTLSITDGTNTWTLSN